MMNLTVDEIEKMHALLIERTGGSQGLRDKGLLESAVLSCIQTFDEEELYPTAIDKAAHLAFGLCKNHPFVDGNKRIAVLSMLMMLTLNEIQCLFSQKELIDLGLGIADGTISEEKVKGWILEHQKKESDI